MHACLLKQHLFTEGAVLTRLRRLPSEGPVAILLEGCAHEHADRGGLGLCTSRLRSSALGSYTGRQDKQGQQLPTVLP